MLPSPSSRLLTGRSLITVPLTLALTVLAVGCATHERAQLDVSRVVHDWHRPRARATMPPSTEVTSQQTADAMPDSSPTRPVDGYIREAMARNPSIQAAIAEARAKLERIPQVTSLPDPIIRTVTRPEPIQTAAGDMNFTLGVAQTIPMLAKLERAGNIAAAETRIALERLNSERLTLIADVERAYWQIYRLDRYLEITGQNRRLLEDLDQVVGTQYQVGKIPQKDLLRVQTELAKLRDDEHRYQIQRTTAAAALNQLTDYPPNREIPITKPIDVPAVNADVERLIAIAAQHNPELAGLREQLERDRQQIELAKLGYWPDITVGVEWNHLDPRDAFVPPVNPQSSVRRSINRASEVGDDNWAIMVQMNIPVWSSRIEAAKREARQRLLATQNRLRSKENLIAFRIFDAWSRIEAQQQTLSVLETELIPQSQQTYEVTLTAYQAGQADFNALVDNWRRWLSFELMRHREMVDLETAFADLQREVGAELLRRESTQDSKTNAQTGDITDES